MDDFDRSDTIEDGDAETSEGYQIHEDPKQVLSKGHAVARMQYDERYRNKR